MKTVNEMILSLVATGALTLPEVPEGLQYHPPTDRHPKERFWSLRGVHVLDRTVHDICAMHFARELSVLGLHNVEASKALQKMSVPLSFGDSAAAIKSLYEVLVP